MPVYDFVDGAIPPAATWNANLRDQVVSTVTSASRPTGTEAQLIAETDTDLLKIYSGSWIDFGAYGQWQTYTPAVTQSATITKTITYCRYNKIGRQVTVSLRLELTSAGTANNPVQVSLPFAAIVGADTPTGSGWVYDASAASIYTGTGVIATSQLRIFGDTTAVVAMGQTGSTFSVALASGDAIGMFATYESTT